MLEALEALRSYVPTLAGRSGEIEDAGTVPADIVESLVATGAFKLWVPAALGGSELSVPVGLAAVEATAFHDGSVGWCLGIAITTSVLAGYLDDEHASAIYGPPDAITGGFAAPVGRATPVPGGLRVSGRWSWGSGVRHCSWIGGGTLVADPEGTPRAREDGLRAPFVFLEPSDVELEDTWQVAGLRGTGSVDYRVDGVIVPEGRWAQVGLDTPRRPSPLTSFSQFGLLASGVAAAALGIGRRAVAEATLAAGASTPQGSRRTLAERAPVQAGLAAAEAGLSSARAYFDDVTGRAWEAAVGGAPDPELALELRLASVHAAQTAARVAADCFELGGGAAVYHASPLQRCWRDAAVASHHAMVAPRVLELVGRVRLGLETDTRQL